MASNSSFSYSEQSIGDYVVCYCAGTLILTLQGEVSVEDLQIGDIVVTASGKHRPIKWIGTRSYIGRFANANSNVLPVRFKAGSLADGIPARDLRVSPKHAMFLDGVLIPAEHLVNGVSIVKEERVEELTYFHIELESHDVLIAEGAASESFVDDNGRGIFHNAHTFAAMYPNEQRVTAVYYAPRVEHGFVLEAVRQRLNERAGLQVPAASRFGELRGVIEGCDGTRVWGWAQDQAYPDSPVCLDVLVDGQVVSLVYADKPTAEYGAHGFTISLPETLSDAATVAVRRSADRATLGSLTHSMPSVKVAA
ncbi:Hint domain-containing protein [Methylorubrum extorquens]|nr:Hint domain-containing protein [Methylorubrum extorquens]